MTKWTKDEAGNTVVHDEATGRTYSISSSDDGGYVVQGVSRGGRARSAINQCDAKSQAVLEVLNHLKAGKGRIAATS